MNLTKEISGINNVTFTCLNTLAWATLGIQMYYILGLFLPTFKNYKTEKQRYEFVSYTVGLIHGIISTGLGFYTIFYTCDGWEQGITPINDQFCVGNAKDIHFKIMLNSCGYLIFDFILYFFLVGASGSLAYQTYAHHVLAATGFMSACYV